MAMKRLMILAVVVTSTFAACRAIKTGIVSSEGISQLSGTWELNYISGPRIAFNGLYPAKAPIISFDISNKKFSGNTSCNSFSGKLDSDDSTINFTAPLMMTKMACPGEGEATFIEMLRKVSTYSITNDSTLNFMMGDIAIMRFDKK